jgi:hypothetical protein
MYKAEIFSSGGANYLRLIENSDRYPHGEIEGPLPKSLDIDLAGAEATVKGQCLEIRTRGGEVRTFSLDDVFY